MVVTSSLGVMTMSVTEFKELCLRHWTDAIEVIGPSHLRQLVTENGVFGFILKSAETSRFDVSTLSSMELTDIMTALQLKLSEYEQNTLK